MINMFAKHSGKYQVLHEGLLAEITRMKILNITIGC